MKTLCTGLLYLFLAGILFTLYSQEIELKDLGNKGTELSESNTLSNLPFQIGLEFGPAIPLKEKKYFNNGWWIYGNVNLYSKRIFLRFAYGNLKLNEELGGIAPYLQFGGSAIPFTYKQHSVSINLGICFYSIDKRAGLITYCAGLNYLYRFNEYVSVTGGIQMPVIRESRYNEHFQNPFLTLGVLFF